MPKFDIPFNIQKRIEIEAPNEEEARRMIEDGEYDEMAAEDHGVEILNCWEMKSRTS